MFLCVAGGGGGGGWWSTRLLPNAPSWYLGIKLTHHQADVRNKAQILPLFTDVDTVFHVASIVYTNLRPHPLIDEVLFMLVG